MNASVDSSRTRFDVGAVRVDRVLESEVPILDPLEVFPEATPSDLERELTWLAPHFYDTASRLLVTPIQGFVVRVRGTVIVVDTCVGDCKNRRRRSSSPTCSAKRSLSSPAVSDTKRAGARRRRRLVDRP